VDHHVRVQRSVFSKACIERAIHTTRIGLQAILDCSLLSLDLENAFNTISRRSFLAEMYKNPNLHPIIPLVEMIYSRTPRGIVSTPITMLCSCTAPFSLVRVSDKDILSARFCSTWRSAPPSGILENSARIQRRSKPFPTMESI
jgi:hypothetical protein